MSAGCLLAFLPSSLPPCFWLACWQTLHRAHTQQDVQGCCQQPPADPPRRALPCLLCQPAAAVTTQMTASTYSSFKETDVSVSIAAQVAVVQVRLEASCPPGCSASPPAKAMC